MTRVVTEGVSGVRHYHLSEAEHFTTSLCGARTMQTAMKLEDWKKQFGQHFTGKRPTFCNKCDVANGGPGRTEEIRAVLYDISGAPSSLDWDWEHDITPVVGGGFLITTSFHRRDTLDGKIRRGSGRKWYVPEDVDESAIVKTAFASMKLILEHELMEHFLYKGARIFDPHRDVLGLVALEPLTPVTQQKVRRKSSAAKKPKKRAK